jgi:hypothetical protein
MQAQGINLDIAFSVEVLTSYSHTSTSLHKLRKTW